MIVRRNRERQIVVPGCPRQSEGKDVVGLPRLDIKRSAGVGCADVSIVIRSDPSTLSVVRNQI